MQVNNESALPISDSRSNIQIRNENLLTQKEWILQSSEEKIGNAHWDLQVRSPSDADDRYIFRKDGKFLVLKGAANNDPGEPDVKDTGTWEIRKACSELAISFTGDTSPELNELLVLTDRNLTVLSIERMPGETVYTRQTFSHP